MLAAVLATGDKVRRGAHRLGVRTAPALVLGLVAAAMASPAASASAETGQISSRAAQSSPTSEKAKSVGKAALPSNAALVRMGAVFGRIEIDNENIFNLANPKDRKAFLSPIFRLANRLHIKTRRSLIRDQLLFRSGEPYSPQLLAESARLLRADPYFYDASIHPVSYHDGKVDVLVTTRDVWTLNPEFDFSRSGGTTTTAEKLDELNAFGTGTEILLEHLHEVDRTVSEIELSTQHALGTWTTVDLAYGRLSDGRLRQLIIERPFYAFETRHAGGVSLSDSTMDDSLYDQGQIIDRFHALSRRYQFFGGWSSGLEHGWTRRWSLGLTYDEHRFGRAVHPLPGGTPLLPRNRKFVYPWIEFDLAQNRFVKLRNHNEIDRIEDFDLGAFVSARVGWAGRVLGSSEQALRFALSAGDGFPLGHGDTLLVSGSATGRLAHGVLDNGVFSASLTNFAAQSSQWLFYSSLRVVAGHNLDLDNQILLGGDNGLEGYPLRYQDGTASALLTLEERWFSNWYPLRLVRVGAAAFFDMGRTWGRAALAAPSLGMLKDVGFGLRLGNSRSAFGNVIHIDLAFPINGGPFIRQVQFLVTTQKGF